MSTAMRSQGLSSYVSAIESAIAQRPTRGAVFSQDRQFRYLLWRRWGDKNQFATFVGLNPSTADEEKDDPTIRRCRGFAEDWGLSGVLVVNLFAYRATRPQDLFLQRYPIGEENDGWISAATQFATRTVACWGNHGRRNDRGYAVATLLQAPECFGISKQGEPLHPLYMPRSRALQPYSVLR